MKTQPEIRYCEHCKRTYKYTFTDKIRDYVLSLDGDFTSRDIAKAMNCSVSDISEIVHEMKTKEMIFVVPNKNKRWPRNRFIYSVSRPEDPKSVADGFIYKRA